MFKSKSIQHRYLIVFFLFLIAFYGFNIQQTYGFFLFPDEFGYWAYAAEALGYDWSDIVSLGSYYSYGYSLILFPILKVCNDGVMAYRMAVTVNFVLLGIDAVLLYKIAGKMFLSESENSVPFLIGIALFYPPTLFYAKTSMVETVLMSMFLLILYFLYCYLEKNRLPMLLFLLIATVYIHFLHMRAIGVAIAVILTLIPYFVKQSKKAKHFLIAIGICVILSVLGFLVKNWLQDLIYSTTDSNTLHVNDYAGQFDKIRYIFSKDGVLDLICGLAGKVLYLGLASFGLLYFGVAKCLKEIKAYFSQKNEPEYSRLIYLFLLLSLIGEIGINVIYNIHPIRVDSVVYGRYDEFVLPVFMMLGTVELMKCKRILPAMLCMIPAHALMTWLTIYEIDRYQITNIHGYVMVGISYLHNLLPYTTKNFFWSACLFGFVLMAIITGILWIAKKKNMPFLIAGIILIEFLLFARATQIYMEDSTLGAYRDTVMTEKIQELLEREEDRRVIYLQENDATFISSIQFLLMEEKVRLVRAKENMQEYTAEEIDDNDLILINYYSDYGEKLETLYRNDMVEGRFRLFYN